MPQTRRRGKPAVCPSDKRDSAIDIVDEEDKILDQMSEDDDRDNNDDSDDSEVFEVEKILARRRISPRSNWEYLIKWKGFPDEEKTYLY